MKSADAQIAAMRLDWPDFRLTGRAGERLTWRGPLRPLAVEYMVQIVLQTPKGARSAGIGGVPRVTVLAPRLSRRAVAPLEPIPHIYKNEADPTLPFLCLYDPAAQEWSHALLVAQTLVPWTINWLTCYEIWRSRGEWLGGGRHPTVLPAPTSPEASDAAT
ncbi:MAG: hypothetical protein ACT4P0_05730 [Panacagrimonas sp.]